MARSATNALPIPTLRELATSLEASMLECLAKPAKRSVHKLRTSTRRVEAQLELLAMLPELPAHAKPREKLLRLLKKLRRAAGEVRDLDVQRDLIADDTPAKRSAKSKSSSQSAELRKEAGQLRRELKTRREKLANDLVDLLKQEKAQLPLVFGQLYDSLKPAESLSISQSDLTSLVCTWYNRRASATPPDPADTELLHNIRKQAKLARYLAESAPESASKAQRLAARFEDLQEAGGEWHDWLLLAELARNELDRSALLPGRFTAHADKALRIFERRIAKMTSKTSSLAVAA